MPMACPMMPCRRYRLVHERIPERQDRGSGEVVSDGQIRFGTDGWRAVIADEFTMANVCRCAAAIADWVKQTEGADQRGIVVGHDRRFMSEQFAQAVAETLLGQGMRVVYCDHGPVPTP